MKNLLLLFLFVTLFSNAQQFDLEEKTVVGVFEVEKKTKSDLYADINKWISINYNSSKNVIQMNDSESGTIIIKGINSIMFKNNLKLLYPRNKTVLGFVKVKFNHMIEINIKEGKYRVKYSIISLANKPKEWCYFCFDCINFNEINENTILDYNKEIDAILKKGLKGKKKRILFTSNSKATFDKTNSNLIENMKATMLNIEKSMSNNKRDDW